MSDLLCCQVQNNKKRPPSLMTAAHFIIIYSISIWNY
jgi:hypothetical protein